MNKTCGECTMCCKLLGVKELNKPHGVWCSLVQIGKGCGDYENRPQSCQDFDCLWLQSAMPETMRPDKIKAVFGSTTDAARIVVHIDPATPDHWNTNREVVTLIDLMLKACEVIVVCGEKRTLLSGKPK